MVEQSTAASHSLAKEAAELAELAGKFDIGEAPATRTAPKPQAPKRHKPTAPRALPTQGATALKPVAETDEDNWENF
jgi:methyl-accepting chemotaxis protein